jgi:hypothetical protein
MSVIGTLQSVISEAIQCQGWKVEQISFVTGARSVNKEELSKNLKFLNVSETTILEIHIFETGNESIRCIREYSQMHV